MPDLDFINGTAQISGLAWSTENKMIEIKQLSRPYGLQEISCQIPQGKLIGIMGGNGAGKSTLLKSLAGILPPTSGEIYYAGRPLSTMNAAERNQQIAYLAQDSQIHWDLDVQEVISLGLTQALPAAKAQAEIIGIAQQFSLASLLHKPFRQLSGGEKARVQLARCCIKKAPWLLADEPIAALDPYYQLDILTRLKSLTPQQSCIIAIHHLELAYRFCDEIILLQKGHLLAAGSTEAVLTAENLAQAFGIRAQIDLLHRQISHIEKCDKGERPF